MVLSCGLGLNNDMVFIIINVVYSLVFTEVSVKVC